MTRTVKNKHRTNGKLRDTPESREKHCRKCDEWWPADNEFFFADSSDSTGLFYCCKACYREWELAREAKKAAALQDVAP